MRAQVYRHQFPLVLESGRILPGLEIAYHTYGMPGKPVVWVCHALTANSDVFEWWKGLFGPGYLFNPTEHFIVCANVLGSCYGTTGPLSRRPNGRPWFHDFPEITIRDMVQVHRLLMDHLKIQRIAWLLGASLGGQQALEWAVSHPAEIENLIPIATNAVHSPWGVAFNESQRMAIRADQSWRKKHPDAGRDGLKAARAMALLSYRNYFTYAQSQSDDQGFHPEQLRRAVTYQRYQGEKLAHRFNAYSYYRLSQAMDNHDLGRGRISMAAALGNIAAQTLVISIVSDVLFPPHEQELLAQHIPGALYTAIDSAYGHDGFLIETAQLTRVLQPFIHHQYSKLA